MRLLFIIVILFPIFINAQFYPEKSIQDYSTEYLEGENLNGKVKSIKKLEFDFNRDNQSSNEKPLVFKPDDSFFFELDSSRNVIRYANFLRDSSYFFNEYFIEKNNIVKQIWKGKPPTTFIYFYNENGRRDSIQKSTNKNNFFLHTKYEYNEEGFLKKKLGYKYGDETWFDEWYFDEKDRIIRIESFYNGVKRSEYHYEYLPNYEIAYKEFSVDSDSLEIEKHEVYFESDSLRWTKYFRVGTNSFLEKYGLYTIVKEYFNSNGKISRKLNYSYDINLQLDEKRETYFFYENNSLRKRVWIHSAYYENRKITQKYDEKGKLLSKLDLIYNNTPLPPTVIGEDDTDGYFARANLEYRYNSNGELITIFDKKKNIVEETWEYRYDEKGNWIERVIRNSEIIKNKIIREIEYWD